MRTPTTIEPDQILEVVGEGIVDVVDLGRRFRRQQGIVAVGTIVLMFVVRCLENGAYLFVSVFNRPLVGMVSRSDSHTGVRYYSKSIEELQHAAAMAKSRYMTFAPHNPNAGVSTAATLHLCA